MACIDEIICLGEVCSCSENITLNLVAQSTGIYKMIAKFNGVRITRLVDFIQGEKIVVPNVFNENYLHEIWFEDADGALYNNVHFSIKTVYCISPEPYTPPTPIDDYNSIISVSTTDTTLVDERLIGKVVTAYIVNDYSKNTDFTKPLNSDTLTLLNGNTFEPDSVVTIIFE